MLWHDMSHYGVAEGDQFKSLDQLGISELSLTHNLFNVQSSAGASPQARGSATSASAGVGGWPTMTACNDNEACCGWDAPSDVCPGRGVAEWNGNMGVGEVGFCPQQDPLDSSVQCRGGAVERYNALEQAA